MSRNVITAMNKIIAGLKMCIEEEDKHRILLDKFDIKANVDDDAPVEAFVAKSEIYIKYTDNLFLCGFKFNDSVYILVPNSTENFFINMGLEKIDDAIINDGAGMLAIACNVLPLRDGVKSLDIINACLGEKEKEILFSEIQNLYEEYSIIKVPSDRFKLEYDEDFERIHSLMILDKFNCSETFKSAIEKLLLAESSRSIALAIYNALISVTWEYSYLQLYQCLEYLFIIKNGLSLADDYDLTKSTAVDIAASGKLKSTELENLVSVISSTSEMYIDDFYSNIINDGDVDNKKQSVAKYIYKIRCNIAHLRFNQDVLDIDGIKNEILQRMAEIIFNTYENNKSEIIEICNDKKLWKEIVWCGNDSCYHSF